MKRTRALIGVLIILVCLLIVPAIRFFSDRHPAAAVRTTPALATPTESITQGRGVSAPAEPDGMKKGVIYVVSATGGDDNSLVARPVTWRSGQSPALDALNALAKAEDSPLPSGTLVRGVKLAEGLATVDFSREFQTNFHGGDTQEAQTVNSILLTLGQFPGIDRVQILVAGKPIDALSQLMISGPLDVLRPQAVRQARDGGN